MMSMPNFLAAKPKNMSSGVLIEAHSTLSLTTLSTAALLNTILYQMSPDIQ